MQNSSLLLRKMKIRKIEKMANKEIQMIVNTQIMRSLCKIFKVNQIWESIWEGLNLIKRDCDKETTSKTQLESQDIKSTLPKEL